jgi:hypothetical protein
VKKVQYMYISRHRKYTKHIRWQSARMAAIAPNHSNSAFSKIYMYNNKSTNTHQKGVKCLKLLTIKHPKLSITYNSICLK